MAVADTMMVMYPAVAVLDTDPPVHTVLNTFLAAAAGQLDVDEWGSLYELACIYLAAHMIFKGPLGAASGAPGGVGSESAGSMSRSYTAVSGSVQDAELNTTAPGAALVRMRMASILPVYPIVLSDQYAL